MNYGYQRTVQLSFEDADNRIRETLEENGFGVLTEIDVKNTLKKKLDKDFQKYTILGACNPPLAFEALNDEQAIGLLLPCNVVLWENEDLSTTIAAIDANKMMTIVENNHLYNLANKVNTLLQKAVDNV
ncbi:MAG: DUF302 domain-containing protein [Candidatus Neomarinimicrobiota bacterium]|jgi:uncharacterized protein (DUF302 family)|uniref:DUF302 domain-containing protein n=1 Tax=marine metagenome TaxID=408172 RepID=A0A381U671_9ZZZZ|nr:DUF302 domain-containing protein [Candidatus Neomarinimicrobiota bacterium]|tara:strand:- start:319 stop:705 length:387 start_codon:yes stop_codon:yes gene_type:complete